MFNRIAVLSLLVCALAITASAASVVPEFSLLANPNGVWTYGYMDGSGLFTPFTSTQHNTDADISGWGESGFVPGVWKKNGSGPSQSYLTTISSPLWLNLHPYKDTVETERGMETVTKSAVVRYTAPAAGNYTVRGRFVSHDSVGAYTDVSIAVSSAAVFTANVIGVLDPPTGTPVQEFSFMTALLANDTVDFIVSTGDNMWWDTTGLQAEILTDTPEPGTLALFGVGIAILGFARFRRH